MILVVFLIPVLIGLFLLAMERLETGLVAPVARSRTGGHGRRRRTRRPVSGAGPGWDSSRLPHDAGPGPAPACAGRVNRCCSANALACRLSTTLRCRASGTTMSRESGMTACRVFDISGGLSEETAGPPAKSSFEAVQGHQVQVTAIECAVADFFGLLRATAHAVRTVDYDIQVGLEWAGPDAVRFLVADSTFPGDISEAALPVHFVPVRSTIHSDSDDEEFRRHAYEIALDCVNQGGVAHTSVISPPG